MASFSISSNLLLTIIGLSKSCVVLLTVSLNKVQIHK
jgi:hypothetical protein